MVKRSTNKITRILAIETSCDETAIASIEAPRGARSFRVLSNIVLSQVAMHAEWGGVVPNLAKREHQKALVPLLLQALKQSWLFNSKRKNKNVKLQFKIQKSLQAILERESELLKQLQEKIIPLPKPPIDLIAITQGPGLEPALWVGVNFARALSVVWDIPLIGINHMEGHIVSALIEPKRISNVKVKMSNLNLKSVVYPALALLVSGGHTELVFIKKPLHHQIIGETRDDAAGEAFDKVARILGLGYPGGPVISSEANLETADSLGCPVPKLPRPMIHSKDFDFSFSGLKTAVLYLVRDLEKQGADIKKLRPAICKEFENAVVDMLVSKTLRAAKQYKIKTILLCGGVAANISL